MSLAPHVFAFRPSCVVEAYLASQLDAAGPGAGREPVDSVKSIDLEKIMLRDLKIPQEDRIPFVVPTKMQNP